MEEEEEEERDTKAHTSVLVVVDTLSGQHEPLIQPVPSDMTLLSQEPPFLGGN